MAEAPDTIPETNSPSPTDPSVPKVDAPAPASSDTNSSTTENPSPAADDADGGSLLNPKPDDAKPEGEAPDAEKPDDEPPANAALFGAPADDATYELTGLPEGVTLDHAALDAVTPLARELNLSNEGLSKLAGVYAESVLPSVMEQMTADLQAQASQLSKEWATEARTAVLGGTNADGEKVAPDPAYAGKTLAEVQTVSAKALDRFGGEGFREFLDAHGLGNHPQMLRFAFQAGSAIGEDTSFERNGDVPSAPKTREEKYYGTNA